MAARLQITEWLEGEPAEDHATPTPRDTLRPAPEPSSDRTPAPHPRAPGDDLPGELGRALGRDLAPHLTTARQLLRERAGGDGPPPLPTAVPELDRLLGEGLPRGHLVELVGRSSSGRFSLVLAILAATTGAGDVAALVDLGDHLDPAGAAAAGADLERLLWIRPRHLREALAATEILAGTGFPLVVTDLGVPPIPRTGTELRGGGQTPWVRLARAARRHTAALVVSTPYRTTGAAAHQVIGSDAEPRYRRGGAVAPRLLLGLDGRIRLEKARGRPPGAAASLRHHIAA